MPRDSRLEHIDRLIAQALEELELSKLTSVSNLARDAGWYLREARAKLEALTKSLDSGQLR